VRLSSIEGNRQRLDGGAMFGNVPRNLWAQWLVPDQENRLEFACRCLLVEDLDGRTVLFEAGIGAFFSPKLKARYGVQEEEHVLLRSLAAHGVAHEDVDVVMLSHLHFDHAGGLLGAFEESKPPELLFPRARFLGRSRRCSGRPSGSTSATATRRASCSRKSAETAALRSART
jgi:glyoxylase-like metal-dependent hydrolase (beta-lactamase superfamily II)